MADYRFASDNAAGICPEAWEALAAANQGASPGYGDDPWTESARRRMREVFETDCETHFVFNGTAANSLAIAAANRSYQSVICHAAAHIDTDECGAPEFFTGGGKVLPLPGPHGKLRPEEVQAAFTRGHGIHFPKPGVLSLTQATEWGTVYQPAEIAALAAVARAAGLRVHLDGARFANAAAALAAKGVTPADLTWRSGVDVLSFGGTKNGLLTSEAIVFFDRELARDFAYRMKQAGQLASKMRFASAQWDAVLRTGAWLRHAANANARAGELAAGLARLAGVRLQERTEANGIFLELPPPLAGALQQRWGFYRFFGDHGYRLMCSWATTPQDVAAFLETAAR
ncbi:MAG TPA: beta-eliminating lyase-related protein [Opitutaceae bacterium]|jgi:threonine aldolase|nr:beta-eliminating lyase-related protein [Opitutaceae bacterium]